MTDTNDHPAEPFWAVLELMGHVRLAGKVSEEERFGSKIGRIDVPADGGRFVTIYFGGSSVYRMTPCDEDTARAVAARSAPAPIHPYEMPKQLQHQQSTPEGDQWHDPEDDEEEDDDDEFSPPF